MEKKSLVLCDTNIIIEFYKKNVSIVKSLKAIGQENIAISIITAGELMINYTLSHKLSLPEGLIAATAITVDIPLYTLNKKDFKYIENLSLYQE